MSNARVSPSRTPASESTDELSKDAVFQTLSNQRRRYIVHYLLQREGDDPVELATLAEQVTAWENDKPVDDITADERKRVYCAMRQSHLPKLDEEGLVDYDETRGIITPSPDLEDLQVYLEVLPGKDLRWHQYYFLLGGCGSLLSIAVLAGTPGFASIPPIWLALGLSVVFTASSIVHAFRDSVQPLGGESQPPTNR